MLPTGVSRMREHGSFTRLTLSVNSGEVRELKRLSGIGDHIVERCSVDFDERGFRARLRASEQNWLPILSFGKAH